MAMNQFGLGFLLTAKDQASAVLSGVNARLQQLVGNTDDLKVRLKSGMKEFAVGAGLAAAGGLTLHKAFELGSVAANFDAQMARVQAMSGDTAEQVAALREGVLNLRSAKFGPSDLALGLEQLTIEGVRAEDQIGAVKAAMGLATVTGMDLGTSIHALTHFAMQSGVGMDRLGFISDKLVVAQKNLEMGGEDYAGVLARAGEISALFGESLDDTIIGIGQLTRAGVQGGMAAASYAEVLRRVASEEAVQQRLQKEGVQVFDLATGKRRSMLDVMMDLREATERMGETERNALLNDISGGKGLKILSAIMGASVPVRNGLNEVTLTGAAAIEEYRRRMAGAAGQTENFLKTVGPQQANVIKRMTNAWEALRVKVGTPFERVFDPVVNAFAGAVERLTRAWDALGPTAQSAIANTVTWGAVVVTAAGATIMLHAAVNVLGVAWTWLAAGPLLKMTTSLLGLVPSFGAVTAAAWAALVPLAPWIALGAGVAAMGFLVYEAWAGNLGGLADTVDAVVGKIERAVAPLWESLQTIGGGIAFTVGAAAKALGLLLDMLGATHGAFGDAGKLWTDVANAFGFAWGKVAQVVGFLVREALVPLEVMLTGMSSLVEAVGAAIRGDLTGALEGLGRVLLAPLAGFAKGVLNIVGIETGSIRELSQAAVKAVEAAIFGALGYIGKGVAKVGSWIGIGTGGLRASSEEYLKKSGEAWGSVRAETVLPTAPAAETVGKAAARETVSPAFGAPGAAGFALKAAEAVGGAGFGGLGALQAVLVAATSKGIEEGMAKATARGFRVSLDGREVSSALDKAGTRERDAALGAEQ